MEDTRGLDQRAKFKDQTFWLGSLLCEGPERMHLELFTYCVHQEVEMGDATHTA